MGSDESHFTVLFIVRDKVTRQCPQTTTFEEKPEPKRNRTEVPSAFQPNALPLGQTGSHVFAATKIILVAAPANDTVLATSRFPINNRPN